MKTIGLLGGMSWESTVTYYQVINTTVKNLLGGLHSAKILLYSVDFSEFEERMSKGDWAGNGEALSDAARRLENAGADFLLICTNSMHKLYDTVQSSVQVPVLHIGDVTAETLQNNKITSVGLLGTKYTMEQDFLRGRLEERGLTVTVPGTAARERINAIIFNELCLGKIEAESKKFYLEVLDKLAQEGCDAVILGCTEIGLLVSQEDTAVPLYDTTTIHAAKAAVSALE